MSHDRMSHDPQPAGGGGGGGQEGGRPGGGGEGGGRGGVGAGPPPPLAHPGLPVDGGPDHLGGAAQKVSDNDPCWW